MSTFQENIANFIGNNLKKVSENSSEPVSKIVSRSSPFNVSSTRTSNGNSPIISNQNPSINTRSISTPSSYGLPGSDTSGTTTYGLKRIGIILIVIIVTVLIWNYMKKYPHWKTNIHHFFSNIIYRFGKNEPDSYEKHFTPVSNSKDKMFNKSNNLNSNEILDYLLNEKKELSTNTEKNEWCFYGKSGGTRYCTLTEGNKCMSGEIFPSKDLCVNPKLKGSN